MFFLFFSMFLNPAHSFTGGHKNGGTIIPAVTEMDAIHRINKATGQPTETIPMTSTTGTTGAVSEAADNASSSFVKKPWMSLIRGHFSSKQPWMTTLNLRDTIAIDGKKKNVSVENAIHDGDAPKATRSSNKFGGFLKSIPEEES